MAEKFKEVNAELKSIDRTPVVQQTGCEYKQHFEEGISEVKYQLSEDILGVKTEQNKVSDMGYY